MHDWRRCGQEEGTIDGGYRPRCGPCGSPAAQQQPAGLGDIVRSFVAEERRRYASIDLRQRYSDRRSPSPVQRLVDAPAFDTGTLDVGFGLLVHGKGVRLEIRLWSRIMHDHK
jgi:hypothetical protein